MNFLLHSELGHFILYLSATAFIGGMPAPTASSSVAYRWMFSSLNSFAMNFTRAFASKVEKSPNFQGALDVQTNIAGVPSIDVKPVDAVPAKM